MQGQHFIPTKYVIALAIGQQIRVFDCAKSDYPRDFAPLVLGQFWAFFRDDIENAFLGFVEQVGEFDDFTRPSFERLAVFAQNGAEPDVSQFYDHFRTPEAKCREKLLEMQLLAAVGNIDDFVRVPCSRRYAIVARSVVE